MIDLHLSSGPVYLMPLPQPYLCFEDSHVGIGCPDSCFKSGVGEMLKALQTEGNPGHV